MMWDRIKEETDKHGYMCGADRMPERIKATGEIFTPTDLVIEILQAMPIEDFGPGKTILDPACGDGQFLVPVKWLKVLNFGMSEEAAENDLWGVDIMRDNVDLAKKRLKYAHIYMGNSLKPHERLPEQTDSEYKAMMTIFAPVNLMSFFRKLA